MHLEQAVAEARLDGVLVDVVGKAEAARDLAEGTLAATSHPVGLLGVMGVLLVRVDAQEVPVDLDAELVLADPSQL